MTLPMKFDGAIAAAEPDSDPAHDLKNLLGVIIGVCESLSEDLENTAESAELARVALLAAERAAGLLDSVLAQQARLAGPALPISRVDGRGRTVLVIEDDPDLLRLMTTAFSRAGFKAFSARNGRLAVQLLRALTPDLMVTDIVMPEKEGIATIIEAKRAAPDTCVIAISGGGLYGRTGNFLQWAEELGADRVMAKPFQMSELLASAQAVLDARVPAARLRSAAG
jgi:CheY-like chemotaxis protein